MRHLYELIDRADREFQKAGGSTRHYVRDHLLPLLDQNYHFLVGNDVVGPDNPDLIRMVTAAIRAVDRTEMAQDPKPPSYMYPIRWWDAIQAQFEGRSPFIPKGEGHSVYLAQRRLERYCQARGVFFDGTPDKHVPWPLPGRQPAKCGGCGYTTQLHQIFPVVFWRCPECNPPNILSGRDPAFNCVSCGAKKIDLHAHPLDIPTGMDRWVCSRACREEY